MQIQSNWLSILSIIAIVLAAACGPGKSISPGDTATIDADDIGDAETAGPVCKRFKLIGQPCDDSCECLGGLCLLNEYSPFRFCSSTCGESQPGAPCAPEVEGEPWNALCVKFPADFKIQPATFCAPLCAGIEDCTSLGAPWEQCLEPTWKGNPLFSSSPDKVCISPSAQGHEPINPETCEGWEGLYAEFDLERATCHGYCDFLDICQILDAQTSETCCAFHCMNHMIIGGKVDKKYFQEIRCYVDNYNAFTGTSQVCTMPLDACGKDPDQP